MSTRVYRKDDVQTHYGSDRPAVNVKVPYDRSGGWDDFARYEPDADPDFTPEWLAEHVSEDAQSEIFWMVCGNDFEQIVQDAVDIFGPRVSVEQDGRSGGWAVVTGLADIEDWDAVALAKWRRFERLAKALAADVPYGVLSCIYLNAFEAWKDERSETLGAEAFARVAA